MEKELEFYNKIIKLEQAEKHENSETCKTTPAWYPEQYKMIEN